MSNDNNNADPFDSINRDQKGNENSRERASATRGAKQSSSDDLDFIGFNVNPRLKERFRDACEANSINMTIALRRYLEFYVNNWEQGERPMQLLDEIGEGTR
jgi:hypothetical protein